MTEGNDTQPEDNEQEQVTLTGYEAYLADRIEHMAVMHDAILESNMRVYDAIIVLIGVISGDRRVGDGLRAQHKEGKYYFPPFSIADAPGPDDEMNYTHEDKSDQWRPSQEWEPHDQG